jgi:hypothetical protein
MNILEEYGTYICWKEEGAMPEKMEGVDTCTGGHEKWLLLPTGTFPKQPL